MTLAPEGPQKRERGLSHLPEPALTVSAVARRLGVAPATLRTWDRRYGLGPSEHKAGGHRRYCATDVARLEFMRSLVVAGVPAAEAAAQAKANPAGASETADFAQAHSRGSDFLGASVVNINARADSLARAGGGNVISTPGADTAARGLARAASALNADACRAIIASQINEVGVTATWDNVLVPVLHGVGDRWESTGEGIEIEHVLSAATEMAFAGVVHQQRSFINARPVMLVSAVDEAHQLPLWALSAALAENNVKSLMLGRGMPLSSLGQAMRKTGPAAVFIWSQLGQNSALPLVTLPRLRPASKLVIGGPGWADDVPPGITAARTLQDALHTLKRAVCG